MRTFLPIGLLFCLGCSPQPSFFPGESDGPLPVDPAASVAPKAEAKVWEHFGEVEKLEVLTPWFPSRGHGTGNWEAELRGSKGAGEKLDALVPGHRMPVGTLLYQSHKQRQVDAQLGAFIMSKREDGYFPAGGDWEYVVIGREGRVEARGKLESCARCHAEAAVDFVFPRLPTAE